MGVTAETFELRQAKCGEVKGRVSAGELQTREVAALGPLSMEQALAQEAVAIGGLTAELEARLKEEASEQEAGQTSERRRTYKDADVRDGDQDSATQADSRRRAKFYRALNETNRSALCLSGGGIRSATFCLGVIQALAAFDVKSGTVRADHGHSGAPEDSLLGRFHYLSTVSGGGYMGSWLSAWRTYDDFRKVRDELIGRPDGTDVEPPEVSWLRAYSNYLTPRVGIGSADAWTAIAIYARNLLLNWLVILPVLCLALFGLKLIAVSSVAVARVQTTYWPVVLIGVFGAVALIVAQAFTTSHRPVGREEQPVPLSGKKPEASAHNIRQRTFITHDLSCSVLSAIAFTLSLCSWWVTAWIGNSGRSVTLITFASGGAVLFAIGWIAGRPTRPSLKDFSLWVVSGLVYGALIGLGAYLFAFLRPYAAPTDFKLSLPIVFGIPWVLMSQLIAEMIFVGLVSYEDQSDSDREWLGRAAGWVSAAAIGWAVMAFLSVGVGNFLYILSSHYDYDIGRYITALGGVSGVATALLGLSGKTPATTDGNHQSWTTFVFSLLLSIAGPVFVATLIVAASIVLDLLMFGGAVLHVLHEPPPAPTPATIMLYLLVGMAVALVVEVIASKNVNINRFSLHAVYRNRLVRGYLGAARQGRFPDQFTGFDEKDNIRAHTLWPPKADDKRNTFGLFHVLNLSLNVVESKRLAWQERKAEPFTVSPRHCGSALLGFRPSDEYADLPRDKSRPRGISLGTAMAISGAAVSPNMGYYSSPSISLLLAFFNVRLGWWLGNPGPRGEDSYTRQGPDFAIKPLIDEAFGLTTDDKRYVYLSDGGHFEDLGLYEMVRRRCRFIVVIDAGEDANFAFEDLGNAVRKIYIDLGIRIDFTGLRDLINRPPRAPVGQQQPQLPYYATGVIDYKAAAGDGSSNGTILYIKPALHWTEPAGIVSYARAHETFPHETTTDQWFTESQFESYRSLGFEITDQILRTKDIVISAPGHPRKMLQQLLAELPKTTWAASPAGSPTRDAEPADASS
jgi:Patatin-like phospholipase